MSRPLRSSQRGASLLELTLAMALMTALGGLGMALWDTGGLELTAAHREIRGSLDQAFSLARARGTNVTVALGQAPGTGEHLTVRLGRKVRWGKPTHIPLPPDMDPPTAAVLTGEAHPRLTVTPRLTALASTWFLHDGEEALCMRLSGHGRLQVLRWRKDRQKWVRA